MGAKGSRAKITSEGNDGLGSWRAEHRSTSSRAGQGFAGNKGIPVHNKGNQKKKGPRLKQKNQSKMEPRNLNLVISTEGFDLLRLGAIF